MLEEGRRGKKEMLKVFQSTNAKCFGMKAHTKRRGVTECNLYSPDRSGKNATAQTPGSVGYYLKDTGRCFISLGLSFLCQMWEVDWMSPKVPESTLF